MPDILKILYNSISEIFSVISEAIPEEKSQMKPEIFFKRIRVVMNFLKDSLKLFPKKCQQKFSGRFCNKTNL